MRTNRRTDMTKLIVPFRNFAHAPTNTTTTNNKRRFSSLCLYLPSVMVSVNIVYGVKRTKCEKIRRHSHSCYFELNVKHSRGGGV
jgi:hypothetical protein